MRSGFLLASLALAGCEAREPGNAFERDATRAPESHAAEQDGAVGGTKRMARAATRPTEVRTPRWPSDRDEFARSRLSDAARAEVDRAPVPVLVVNDPKQLASTVVTTGPHWYATSVRDGGLTVALHGTRLAHVHADIPPAQGRSAVRGQPAFVTENEGIVSASWVENGMAYALDVECFDRADARCHGESFVLGLAARLVFVGGLSSADGEGGTP